MKKILFIIILFLILPSYIFAYTKEDITNLINSISLCDNNSINNFNSYRIRINRIISTKNISQKDIDSIYNNLLTAKNMTIDNGVCSVEELRKMNNKKKIYSLLIDSYNLIINSSDISNDIINSNINNNDKNNIDNNTSSGILIENNSVTIYNNGYLEDKIEFQMKLNDVGLNKIVLISLFSFLFIFIVSLVLNILFKKNILFTITIYVSLICFLGLFIFRNELSNILNITSVLNNNDNSRERIVLYEDNKIISYPSYGSKYGTLSILDKDIDIYFGDSTDVLKHGVGHYTASYMPLEGGTIIYSLHNTFDIVKYFNDIKDKYITINTVYGKFIYVVYKTDIIESNNTSILNISDNKEELIIYTCYPFDNFIYGNKRYVIYANLYSSSIVGGINEKD